LTVQGLPEGAAVARAKHVVRRRQGEWYRPHDESIQQTRLELDTHDLDRHGQAFFILIDLMACTSNL